MKVQTNRRPQLRMMMWEIFHLGKYGLEVKGQYRLDLGLRNTRHIHSSYITSCELFTLFCKYLPMLLDTYRISISNQRLQ